MKYLHVFFLLVTAAVPGCVSDRCEAPLDASETVVPLRLLKASGTQDVFTPPARYSRDSVVLRDEQGQLVPLLAGQKDLEPLSFFLLDKDNDPQIGPLVKRQFILYLSKADQDTIRAEYVLFENDCDRPQFRTLKLYYNAVQVHENSTSIPDLLIRKR
ncbi:hypothetical protein [Hymenobacter elongatus]|uniref:Uncharacterized protein n=1 Tax=Hymenobacter elongatus TaxID=877208 RepID=A0A4Z0PG75_9BACT|nr:hypothetical protein [Hymenobacter elongatus]TGE14123.1 hypothetical protein E5J99_17430 [Hymenobacter elongatus]